MRIDISVIIPVWDEQARINDAIENLRDQSYPGTMEVIVADGQKDGSTVGCIRDSKVIKIISAPGRGVQMNSGAKTASGETLLFLHCDTVLPENAFQLVQEAMQDKRVNAGAFDLSIGGRAFAYRIIERTASLRSRLTRIPCGDQAIFIRRSVFFRLGAYSEIPIMEDVDLMRRLKRERGGICFIHKPVMTSPRRWQKEGLVGCTLRNWMLISLYLCGEKPEKLARFYKNNAD